MKIALVSLDQIWEDKNSNKERCKFFIEKASADNTELVIFPEMTLTGFSMNTRGIAEVFENSDTIRWFGKQAEKFEINIVFGVVLKSNEKVKNHLIFVSSHGEILVNYAKIHPFSFSNENKFYDSGFEIKNSEFDGSKIGFSICYDLRFPELFQSLSKECEVLINIANWPKKRLNHWKILLNARAIENQVFMIGVNRTGIDGNGLEYEKSSLIFSPSGEQMEPIFSNDYIDVFEIDPSDVKEIRNSFPVKNDRKIEFYKSIL